MNLFYPREYKPLLKLGIPITIGQIGLTLQGIADNMMVGRHSTEELAAAGFVNNLFILALLLTIGFSAGAVSQIGASYAQGRKKRIVEIFKGSIFADIRQGAFMLLALVALLVFLPYLGQPEELLPLMRPYLLIQIFSFPFIVLGNPFKQLFDSLNDTSIPMVVSLISNVLNILLNWMLIFGKAGFPEMGIVGAAWATFISRAVMLILLAAAFLMHPKYSSCRQCWKEVRAQDKDMRLLTKLGWPIAVQTGLEAASFTVVVIFIGWLGTSQLAAHQVMNSVSNLVFMSFMGFSSAVSIRVSNHNGTGNERGIREAAFAGYEMVILISLVLSVLMFSLRHKIGFLFTDSTEVAEIVAACMIPLILYQLGDGMQCTFSNALRGLGDVEKLIKYSFIAYIVISIPLSFLFGVVFKLGTFGVWMGYPFGLSAAAILYLRRFLKFRKCETKFS